uniref:Reverse transcriptase Ty1/copia-type domain-containing protein n=1 Tax=Fagus sylvatica TaxID=28930 RepID=A0A2N9GB72_FAGSY
MTPIFTDPSIDLYPDLMRDSAPPLSSSNVPSLALSPAVGSLASDPAPSAPSVSLTNPCCSTWVRAPPSNLTDYHCYFALTTLYEPHTYREASTNPLWQQVMANELDALHKTHTWDLTTLPPGMSAVGCKWVYKFKTQADESVERYKARLLTSWFLPTPGFSQTQSVSSYVGHYMVLKQAPRAWFAKFSSTISQHGFFTPSSYDSALFIPTHTIHWYYPSFLLYVDDMIITVTFLGLEVSSSSFDGYYLTQAKYTSDLISRGWNHWTARLVDTPIEYNVNRLNTTDGEPLPDATPITDSLVGQSCLISLSLVRTFPMLFTLLVQFMAAPRSLIMLLYFGFFGI